MTPEEERPLLPTLADNPRVAASLRESLAVLRDAADPALRRRIDAVLDGEASLRDLARDEEFAGLVGPLAERGWTQWEALPEEDRQLLAAEAEAFVETHSAQAKTPGGSAARIGDI